MKFEIKNFGQINTANIDLKKINIITGKNNVVKSNLTKIIYCFLAPASKDNEMITEYRIYKELLHIIIDYEVSRDEKLEKCHELLYVDKNKECLELFKNIIGNDKNNSNEYTLKELKRIASLFEENEIEQYFSNLNFLLNSEYCYPYGLINNTKIKFSDLNLRKVLIENDKIKNGLYDLELENILFMNISEDENHYHNRHVRRKLYCSKHMNDEEIKKITDKISNITKDSNRCEVPSGIMQLDKIRRLLLEGQLTKNSYLMLDNPENDLHPKLQVKFAEILVLMALKLNITIYVNTNSPFLTEAIEAYSKLYNIYNQTNFYHVEKDLENKNYNLKLLDDLSIGKIYKEYDDAFEMIKNIQRKIKLGVDEGYF